MVRLEEHEGLTVNLLQEEVIEVIRAAREVLDEIADLLHRPLQGVVLQDRRRLDGGSDGGERRRLLQIIRNVWLRPLGGGRSIGFDT